MPHVLGTAPYAWPFDASIAADRLALVLAGWDEGWAGRCRDDLAVVRSHCAALAQAVHDVGALVVTVAHDGAEPLPPPVAGPTLSLTAAGIDGSWGGPLEARLRREGRTHLLVAGLGLEGPVHSTLRAANDRGDECLLVADACAALEPELRGAAIKTVTMSGGIFGAVGDTGPVLAALSSVPSPQEAQP